MMSENLEQKILAALSHVEDPDLKKDLVTLGMIKNLEINGKRVSFQVELTTPACPMKDMLHNACVNAVKHLVDPNLEVDVEMTARVTTLRNQPNIMPGVKNIIAVGSGKGGVGKSTVAVNLALELQKSGARVGILDADIYGPSVPLMFGVGKEGVKMKDEKMMPVEVDGISLMSIGFLVPPEQAVVWRGPMVSSAIRQFISDVEWGNLDYLFVDMPPGTGDVHITIAQNVPLTGAVMVTTPQEVAVADCRKALAMFNMDGVKVPVLGIVENMSWFSPPELPDNRYYIFGSGGANKLASDFNVDVLGEVPLELPADDKNASGKEHFTASGQTRKAFSDAAAQLVRQVAILNSKAKAE